MIAALTAIARAAPGSCWAPSFGSSMIASTTPSSSWSAAVMRIAAAAVGAFSGSRHRMAAQPSGEITEYTAFSSASTSSPTPIASAPPDPPSPSTTTTIGTCRPVISLMLVAIASAWPRSSAAGPGKAPAVSRKVIDRHAELLGQVHQALRLAEALRMRRPEVAEDVRLGVGSLLVADHHHRPSLEQGRSTRPARGRRGMTDRRGAPRSSSKMRCTRSSVRGSLRVPRQLHAPPGRIDRRLVRLGAGNRLQAGGSISVMAGAPRPRAW